MKKNLSRREQEVARIMGQMRLEEFRKMCNNLVPCIYSCLAISLYEKGWRGKRIGDLFARSQEIWVDNCTDGETMAQKCYELTGIDVRLKDE